jgi:hypothetical protein
MKTKTQRLTDHVVLEELSKKYPKGKKLTEKQQMKIVEKFPLAITLFANPSNEVLTEAAARDVEVLRHFKNVPEEVQIEVLLRHVHDAMTFIERPTPFVKVLHKVLETDDPLTAHERLVFVEKALEMADRFPTLLRLATSEGWV